MPPAPAAAPHLLTRSTHRATPDEGLRILGGLCLPFARVHEICGAARRTLALVIARETEGPIFWVRPRWVPDQLNGAALPHWVDPGRIIYFSARRPEDMLWTLEEALRGGIVPLVVGDLTGEPGLTSVRRMHLAAETGAKEQGTRPLGLLLTPGRGGAPGIETRWRFSPAHGMGGETAWTLDRLRARTLPPASWRVYPGKGGALQATAAPVNTDA